MGRPVSARTREPKLTQGRVALRAGGHQRKAGQQARARGRAVKPRSGPDTDQRHGEEARAGRSPCERTARQACRCTRVSEVQEGAAAKPLRPTENRGGDLRETQVGESDARKKPVRSTRDGPIPLAQKPARSAWPRGRAQLSESCLRAPSNGRAADGSRRRRAPRGDRRHVEKPRNDGHVGKTKSQSAVHLFLSVCDLPGQIAPA